MKRLLRAVKLLLLGVGGLLVPPPTVSPEQRRQIEWNAKKEKRRKMLEEALKLCTRTTVAEMRARPIASDDENLCDDDWAQAGNAPMTLAIEVEEPKLG